MIPRGKGVGVANWLVSKTSGLLDAKLTRRSLISRATLVGSAVAVSGCAVVARPGTPYTRVTDCGGNTLCRDGYTEFCCVINQGINACPPNTITAGWWRADYSVFCNGTRYYIDCNESCCGPRRSDGFCAGCSPVRCADGCNTRKVYANYFRYGQCHQVAAHVGPIACRMVTCVPPYQLNIGCTASGAVDNSTANHNANCAAYLPPAPPPPAAEVSLGAALLDGAGPAGLMYVMVRGGGGDIQYLSFDGTTWAPWSGLGDQVTSRVVAVSHAPGEMFVVARSVDNAYYYRMHDGVVWSAWTFLDGTMTSDPAVVVDQVGGIYVVGRASDKAYWFRYWDGATWTPWTSLAGSMTSDPAVVMDQLGAIHVVGRASDNAYWFRRRDPGGWTAWTSLAGTMTSDPALIVDQAGDLFVVGRASDNAFWFRRYGMSGWTGWTSLAGSMTSDPALLVDQAGDLYVMGRASDNGYWFRRRGVSGWSAWTSLAGTMTSNPALVEHQSGDLYLFGRSTDHVLWYRRRDPSGWLPWATLAGSIESVRGAPTP